METDNYTKETESNDEGSGYEFAGFEDSFQVLGDDENSPEFEDEDLMDESKTVSTIASSDPVVIDNDGKHSKEEKKEKLVGGKEKSRKKRKRSVSLSYEMNSSISEKSSKLISQLKVLYKKKVMPIEQDYGLYNFCLPTNEEIQDSEFDAKPMVLLLGQYSTGKTTFIRHLVGGDFPGQHIGPEPTTDKFMALVHGDDGTENGLATIPDDDSTIGSETNFMTKAWSRDGKNNSTKGKVLKGNSLTVTPELPFSTLSSFGTGFLSHFVGSISSAPLLRQVTLIDTPGVLSGEKQRLSRSYDFAEVAKWFANRSDLILLLFDAHKLDISDELKEVIETIRPHNDDKMRCVLNKADGVTREQLVRVYGSLMWSMGKIFNSPEVVRVYTGSYWENPLLHKDFEKMFDSDERLLIQELVNLPKSCAERKVNELVKRIRIIKVHVCILTYLKRRTPRFFGKKKAMKDLIDNLDSVFDAVRLEYKLSGGDFPNVQAFSENLRNVDDFSSFRSVDKNTLRNLDALILKEIPLIMKGSGGVSGPSDETIHDTETNAEDSEIEKPDNYYATKAYLMLALLFILALSYICMFMFIMKDGHSAESILPEVVIRHFVQVGQYIRRYVFDTIPSGDALV